MAPKSPTDKWPLIPSKSPADKWPHPGGFSCAFLQWGPQWALTWEQRGGFSQLPVVCLASLTSSVELGPELLWAQVGLMLAAYMSIWRWVARGVPLVSIREEGPGCQRGSTPAIRAGALGAAVQAWVLELSAAGPSASRTPLHSDRRGRGPSLGAAMLTVPVLLPVSRAG